MAYRVENICFWFHGMIFCNKIVYLKYFCNSSKYYPYKIYKYLNIVQIFYAENILQNFYAFWWLMGNRKSSAFLKSLVHFSYDLSYINGFYHPTKFSSPNHICIQIIRHTVIYLSCIFDVCIPEVLAHSGILPW